MALVETVCSMGVDFWVLVVAAVYVAAAGYVFAELYNFNVVDDAYISFRYAQNWALGRGVVFNPGERVEGYTNFLWVAVMVPLYWLSSALQFDFTKTTMVVGTLFSQGSLVLTFFIGRRLFGKDAWWATSLALLVLALDNAFVGYAVSGLENPMLTFLLLLSVSFWVYRPKRYWLWTGLALAAMNMTRPDAALAVGTLGLSALLGLVPPAKDKDRGKQLGEWRDVLKIVAVWAAVYGAYFAWRYHYYGWLFPNTFYLKVGATLEAFHRGWEYDKTFFVDRLYIPVFALSSLLWWRNSTVRWLFLYALLHLVYIAYVGGDFYTGHRFLVVLQPVLALLVVWPAARFGEFLKRSAVHRPLLRSPRLKMVAGAIGGFLVGYLLLFYAEKGYEVGPFTMEVKRWGAVVDRNVRYQKWLRTFAVPNSYMVVGDIGATGFFADLKVIDVLGVVDVHVAHKKVPHFGRGKPGHEKHASFRYVMDRHPRYVKWGWLPGDLRRHGYYIFNEFPPGLMHVAGLWIRDDDHKGRLVPGSTIGFAPNELRGWTRQGSAFASTPTFKQLRNQNPVFGQSGWYIDSYTAKARDLPTGRMLSPPIVLRGDKMFLSVGGGYDPDRLRVSLLVDGKRVRNATGNQAEVLGRRQWDIRPFKGKTGRIEIVDQVRGPWGHILVDDIYQWNDAP